MKDNNEITCEKCWQPRPMGVYACPHCGYRRIEDGGKPSEQVEPRSEQAQMAQANNDTAGMWFFSVALITIGVAAMAFSFMFDVSVDASYSGDLSLNLPSRVANVDKIAVREIICMTGCAFFISGVFLSGINCLRFAIHDLARVNRE